MDPTGAAGCGYVIVRGSSNAALVQGKGRFGPVEVIDTEIIGALQGLRAAKRLSRSTPIEKVFVCLDNTAALTGITGSGLDTSQQQCLDFRSSQRNWRCVSAKWSPGHSDILGNELADKLVNEEGTSLPELTGQQGPSLASIRRNTRSKQHESLLSWWEEAAPEDTKGLH